MKRFGVPFIFASLMLLTACPQTSTPTPQKPVTPPADPTVFPVSEISGTLPNWSGGKAYLTMTSGYSVGSGGEGNGPDVMLGPPTYNTALSAEGSFTVPLGVPAASELAALTCGAKTYSLGLLTDAVVSSVPQPTQAEEFLAAYNLGPSDNLVTNAVWVYSAEALELDTTCTLPGSSPAAVKLKLVPGWNQALLTYGEEARLESAPVPTSFVWSEF